MMTLSEVIGISVIVIIFVAIFIATTIYKRRIGVKSYCPNCGQQQTGWSTQCIKCGVVFKEWKE